MSMVGDQGYKQPALHCFGKPAKSQFPVRNPTPNDHSQQFPSARRPGTKVPKRGPTPPSVVDSGDYRPFEKIRSSWIMRLPTACWQPGISPPFFAFILRVLQLPAGPKPASGNSLAAGKPLSIQATTGPKIARRQLSGVNRRIPAASC